MNKKINAVKARRKFRVGKNISGTAKVPRLSVYRSLNGIYAQLIDDATGKTLVSASTLSKEIEAKIKEAKSKVEKSIIVGEFLAKCALEKELAAVVFDRNGFRYHGRVKALADGARKGGLKF